MAVLDTGILSSVTGGGLAIGGLGQSFRDFRSKVKRNRRKLNERGAAEQAALQRRQKARELQLAAEQGTTSPVDTANTADLVGQVSGSTLATTSLPPPTTAAAPAPTPAPLPAITDISRTILNTIIGAKKSGGKKSKRFSLALHRYI
jgi:hypothetical protein